MMNGFEIDVTADVRMQHQRTEFGSEDQLARRLCVKQRFLANSIPREKKRLGTLIPNRERKHAAQMLWAIGAILFVSGNDRFRVAIGIELVAKLLELLAQLAIVVNLSIENDPFRAIAAMNWLLPGCQIDNGKTAHREADAVTEVKAVIVGPAVINRLVHPLEQMTIDGRAVCANHACNATHACLFLNVNLCHLKSKR